MYITRKVIVVLFFFLTWQAKAQQVKDTANIISLDAIGGLKYDKARFSVKAGAKVKLILTNKDDMSHNLVITAPGARMDVVNASMKLGSDGSKMNYIPKIPEVLWAIPLLLPGESKSITFTAPAKPGLYPYVCTYPGHGFVMFGEMRVTDKGAKENKKQESSKSGDKNNVVSDAHAHHENPPPAHPYKTVPPFMYRVFIPDASPAAIAVSLPQNISYCWDAGTCRLRYAWQGDFLDNTTLWKGHRDAYGKILGTVFYRDKTTYPFHIDQPGNIPTVQFRGYRLIDRYPEFHYTMNGIEVFELLKSRADGKGLIRTFRIPKTDRIIWFICDPSDGISYQSSAGKWIDGKLKLLPEEAVQFTLTMTQKGQ